MVFTFCDFPTEHSIAASSKILQGNPANVSRQLADYLRPVEIGGQTWKLCFRASEKGFLSQTFHVKCNHKGPTVTLVRVGQHVFGGYSDREWTSSKYRSASVLRIKEAGMVQLNRVGGSQFAVHWR